MFIFCYLFSARKLISYLWLYLIYFLTIVTTFTYTLLDCDLIPRCTNEYNTSIVENLSNITCSKSMSCDAIDTSPNITPQNSFRIALKKFNIIKQNNVSSLVQIILSTSVPPQHEIEGSFLFQIAFRDNDTCYNFVIPFASLSSDKESVVLPCIQLHLSPFHVQRIVFYTYYKELKESKYEVITIQVAMYTLKDTSTVQVIQSGFMNIVPVLDKTHIYLTSNEDTTCPSSYKISIIESVEKDVCDPLTQKIVCQWISVLKSPHLCLNCTRSNLIPNQTYCIYASFFGCEECKYIHPDKTVQVTFFEIFPEKFDENIVSLPFCKGWNNTIVVTIKKKVEVEFNPWHAYDNCFLSYEFLLYTVQSSDCGAGDVKPIHNISVNHTQQRMTMVFPTIPNGIYCFLAIPCDMNICHRTWSRRYKENITIKDQVSNFTPTVKDNSRKFDLNVKIAMGLLLLITGFALVWCVVKKIRNTKDLSNCNSKIFEDSKMGQEHFSLLPLRIIVYIFHSFDAAAQETVNILVDFLQKCANIDVITIGEVNYKIIIKPIEWFDNIIMYKCAGKGPSCSSNIRFIFVWSAKALKLIGQSAINFEVNSEERALRIILMHMQRNSMIFYNHAHVFEVCSDARWCDRELKGILSESCYNMMSQNCLLDLETALRKTSTHQVQRDN